MCCCCCSRSSYKALYLLYSFKSSLECFWAQHHFTAAAAVIVPWRVWLRPCVLFALGEVRRHAWTALRCLTVVFSRCHWLGCARPCWWYYLLWAPAEWVEKRAEPPRPPEPCHSRLPRHLIVRKVSAGPSGPGASTASLSAGQTERHSVLGPGSFFPFSHRLCLISTECRGRKCQITGEPLRKKPKLRCSEAVETSCACCVVADDIFIWVS